MPEVPNTGLKWWYFLIFILLLEIALNLIGSDDLSRIYSVSENPDLGYIHVIGANYTKDNISIVINKDGFRDEKTLDNLEGRKIVGVYGDSLTFGFSTENYFTKILQKEYANQDLYFYNFGVGGYNTRQEVAIISHMLNKTQYPDYSLSVIMMNLNEPEAIGAMDNRLRKQIVKNEESCQLVSIGINVPCFIKDGLLSSKLTIFSHALISAKHTQIKQAQSQDSYIDNLWKDETAAKKNVFEPMSRLPVNSTIIFIVPQNKWKVNDTNSYEWNYIHNKIMKECEMLNLTCIDLLENMIDTENSELWNSPHDLIHYNEKGMQKIAREVIKKINKYQER